MGKHHSEEGGGSAGFLKSPSSNSSSTNSSVSSIKSHLEYHNKMCQVLDTVWSEPSSPLIDNRSFFDSLNDPDQLFLLPDSVLAMDSFTFREDVNSIAPNFLSNSISSNSSTSSKHSPHHSLDSSETNRSLRLLEDIEGFRLARASDGCRTLWLCDATSDGSNVTPLPPQVESSLPSPAHPKSSSGTPPHPSLSSSTLDKADQMLKSTESLSSKKGVSLRNQTSEAWFLFDDEDSEGRSECNREREDRVKRIRELQESDRRRKLEELKQHALSAQKFRLQQELERRRHIEELRLRDTDKRHQVEERKKALEEAERDRRVALLRKNKEREERIEQKRRAQNQMNYAFGSSTPRMIEPRVDSMSDIWGGTRSRSTSSSNVFAQMSQSMYCNRRSAERDPSIEARKQRATSAHGLDRNDVSHLGNFWNPSGSSNYKGKNRLSSCKSGSKVRANSETRDAFTHVQSQPSSPMQESSPLYWLIRDIDIGDKKSQSSGVPAAIPMRLPRTRSRHDCHFITGSTVPMGEDLMSQSFSGALATPNAHRRRTDLVPTLTASSRSTTPRSCKSPATSSLTGGDLRKKRARSVTSDREDDTKSTTSNSSSVMSKSMITRRTPAQVKADSAARKAKPPTSKSSTPTHTATHKKIGSKSPSLSGSIKSLDGSVCQDELKSPKNEVFEGQEPNAASNLTENAVGQSSSSLKEGTPPYESKESPSDESAGAISSTGKRIITSEEEAKARLAEKRRQMKEKKEREAELERQRLAELERIENERLEKEEEEERLAMVEAEKLAGEARKVEELRLQKAIEEAERKKEEDRKKQEEEEKLRQEKEEQEKKKQEELSDKLRKEEEERMLRKKRIEEIMSRTRKPNNQNNNSSNNNNNNNINHDPPSHDAKSSESTKNAITVTTTSADESTSSNSNSEPLSSNKNGEHETSPASSSVNKDINNVVVVETTINHRNHSGGDEDNELELTSNNTSLSADNMNNNNINENMQNHHLQENNDSNDNFVKEENAKNSSKTSTTTIVSSSSSPAEKGVIHSFISENNKADIDKNGDISSHPDRDDNTIARMTENNDTRQDLDQIMELSVDSNNDITTKFSPPSTPIIAFEESINVPKQEPPTADLLS
ncbi:uncharacterized protein [Lepeophtheirus salmonis]|uniref:uncharacterized protein isoform X9 n=1 Tax=Lepeophtheirus salmonis TaxID=72036 RepID=UPI001AE1C52A|nr:MAP7 domain-containing protein 1-like isoform X6 [Lepeophtheirus salmonis]